ncbi:MAG: glycosyltransferase family 2 protein [Gemmatimonadota bacterium]
MDLLLAGIVGVFALLLLAPCVVDLGALVRRTRQRRRKEEGARFTGLERLLFLVPARNEADVLDSCLQSLLELRYPEERRGILVVADGCDDDTAAVARRLGVRVQERAAVGDAGKGAAIGWALRHIALQDWDAIVVVDADSIVDPEFGIRLSACGPLRDKALQATFLPRNPADSPLTRMAELLSVVYYGLLYPLKRAGGLNVPLTGNGMSLGTSVLDRLGWKTSTLCEDTEMYVILTLGGVRILTAPGAVVRAYEARTLRESGDQRRRWRSGRIRVLSRYGRNVLLHRDLGLLQKADVLAELLLPGPVVQACSAAALGLLAVLAGLPGNGILVGALALSPARFALLCLLALRRVPEPARTAAALLHLPAYAAWRVGAEWRSIARPGDIGWGSRRGGAD